MRKINELIWHCTATPEGREVTVAEINQWHKQRGWSGIGYHKVVHLDGSVSDGRPESKEGAHVSGHNRGTLGYVYVGGVKKDGKTPKDTRTPAQKRAMLALTKNAVLKYSLTKISGHRDYAAKACPCFDAPGEYQKLIQPGWDSGMPSKDPQNLIKSRTLQGSAMSSVGLLGSTATETAQQIEGLSYYSATIGYVFMVLTLLGILLVVYARLDDAGQLPWSGNGSGKDG